MIEAKMVVKCEGKLIPVRAAFDPDAPLIVNLTFLEDPEKPVTWGIGRDLMAEGLESREEIRGLGDVRFSREDDLRLIMCLRITSPDLHRCVVLPAPNIARFLEKTFNAVPRGEAAEAEKIIEGLDALIERVYEEGDRA